jgi:hypothetical protein
MWITCVRICMSVYVRAYVCKCMYMFSSVIISTCTPEYKGETRKAIDASLGIDILMPCFLIVRCAFPLGCVSRVGRLFLFTFFLNKLYVLRAMRMLEWHNFFWLRYFLYVINNHSVYLPKLDKGRFLCLRVPKSAEEFASTSVCWCVYSRNGLIFCVEIVW